VKLVLCTQVPRYEEQANTARVSLLEGILDDRGHQRWGQLPLHSEVLLIPEKGDRASDESDTAVRHDPNLEWSW
jgi:hypothetical protein